MASIMNDESGRMSLLFCERLVAQPGGIFECHCKCFDGSPFTILVPHWKVRFDLKDNSRGWVEVIRHGVADNTISVTLPAPSTRFGSRVRVKDGALMEFTG